MILWSVAFSSCVVYESLQGCASVGSAKFYEFLFRKNWSEVLYVKKKQQNNPHLSLAAKRK